MNKEEGYFVTFEGPDGSGKSTQISLVGGWLWSLGFNVLVTREPGGTDIGDQIRGVIHDLNNVGMVPGTEVLLYQASRHQLVEQVIRPCLAGGGIVLCDRYADSTIACQCFGHRRDRRAIQRVIEYATGGLTPDLTIFFDYPPELGLERRKEGEVEWNRLDAYDLSFHQRVYAGYHQLQTDEPERWRSVDASQEIDEVYESIKKILRKHLVIALAR